MTSRCHSWRRAWCCSLTAAAAAGKAPATVTSRASCSRRGSPLLLDLLTPDEEATDQWTGHLRFDIPFLARRLVAATDWLAAQRPTRSLPLGYFGASTGAAAALIAAAERAERVAAIVSRRGRPDLAGPALAHVRAPTLLIVGSHDVPVIEMNREALTELPGVKELRIVPGAGHLFEEPGTLDEVARLATAWFTRHLTVSPEGAVGLQEIAQFL